MTVEMLALGPCPTCTAPRWKIATCECSHLVMEHDFGKRKGETVRTGCSHSRCDCKSFQEVT